MNIYEKLSAITADISAVAKNLEVGVGSSKYRAVGEADVLAAVKPLEAKYKVYSYPYKRTLVKDDIFTTKTEWQGKVSEKQSNFLRLETVYRFVNMEKPEEYVEITTYGDGVDPQDKAPGKAMTYADKYALLKAYKIITGEDPDQDGSKEGQYGKKAALPKDTPPDEAEEVERIKNAFVNKVQISSVLAELERTGVKETQICKEYGLESISEMRFGEWREVMARLEKVKDKKPSGE